MVLVSIMFKLIVFQINFIKWFLFNSWFYIKSILLYSRYVYFDVCTILYLILKGLGFPHLAFFFRYLNITWGTFCSCLWGVGSALLLRGEWRGNGAQFRALFTHEMCANLYWFVLYNSSPGLSYLTLKV